MPYDAYLNDDGILWSVRDIRTGKAAEVNGIVCDSMTMDDADDLADLLNGLEADEAKATKQ